MFPADVYISIYFALVNNETDNLNCSKSNIFNEEMINNFLTNGTELDKTAIGQIWTGKQTGNEKALVDEDNIWAMILG